MAKKRRSRRSRKKGTVVCTPCGPRELEELGLAFSPDDHADMVTEAIEDARNALSESTRARKDRDCARALRTLNVAFQALGRAEANIDDATQQRRRGLPNDPFGRRGAASRFTRAMARLRKDAARAEQRIIRGCAV